MKDDGVREAVEDVIESRAVKIHRHLRHQRRRRLGE